MASADDPWFPIIYADKCDGCAKTGKPRCIEFCPNDVYRFQDGKAIVANPANCGKNSSTFHCSACAPVCHKRAISFPSKNVGFAQEAKDKGLVRKITCKVCGKVYWTNRQGDVCMDCENKSGSGESGQSSSSP